MDLVNGRMETRMRNLDHKKVLYVEERGTWVKDGERYRLPDPEPLPNLHAGLLLLLRKRLMVGLWCGVRRF